MIPLGSLIRLERDQFGRLGFFQHALARNPATVYRFDEIVLEGGLLYAGDGQTPGGVPIPTFFTPRNASVVYPIGSLVYRTDNGRVYRGDSVTPGGILLQDAGLEEGGGGGIEQVRTPVISPSSGAFDSVLTFTLFCATPGATIRYTTDGSEPSPNHGQVYTAPVTIQASTGVRAVAVLAGWVASQVATATFTRMDQVATPIILPAGQTFDDWITVAIYCATPGASIRYTDDGTTPNAESTLYTAPIVVNASKTILAMATAPGMLNSGVASQAYTRREPSGDRVYWGKNLLSEIDEARILSTLESQVQNTAAGEFQYYNGPGYMYFCAPAAWTSPTSILVNSLPWATAFTPPYTSNQAGFNCRILNINGVPYRVFRGQNTTAGEMFMVVA